MSDTPQIAISDLSALPAAERARRYRELADMHLQMGVGAAVTEARAGHLELAALWTRLATQAEHQATEETERARSSARDRPRPSL